VYLDAPGELWQVTEGLLYSPRNSLFFVAVAVGNDASDPVRVTLQSGVDTGLNQWEGEEK
jgi:hypothetical protein